MSLSLSKKRRAREGLGPHSDGNRDETDSKRLRRELELSQSQTQSIAKDRCGKIIRIHLQNFMCHENLSIEFHERVNFLVGSNGSGKSAIMAALVLGLGAKARATNRSGNMKQFIRTGQKSAKIEITFSNAGSQSYEHDVYGNAVTVTRTINQSGGTFVVRNESGNIISRKVDDLNRILIYHNMQVDNPVFVLNQDSAREFLKELDPRKNYHMFMKATQMELILEKLHECLHSHKEQQIRLRFMKKKTIKNRQELVELNNKLETLINMEAMKEKLNSLILERAWSRVNQFEIEVNEFLEKIQLLEKKKTELERGSGSKSAMETELRNQISELERNLAAKKSDFDAQNAVQQKIKRKVKDIMQNVSEISSIVDSLKKSKSFTETSIIELQNHLDQRSDTNVDEMKRKNQLLVQEHKQSLDELTEMLATTKRDMKIFVDSREEKQEHEKYLREQRDEMAMKLDRLRSFISSINPSAKDKLCAFGNDIMKLVAEINKAHAAGQFTKKPCGPIGSYIEVPNSKYRDVIEAELGDLVKAFIVNDAKDRQKLQNIMRRVSPQLRCTIITTKFQDKVYDVRNGCVQPPHETRTLMSEIKCSDPNAMNCLIDRLRIETILLTDNRRTAEHISSQRENVPVHMSKIIVPKDSIEYYPDPRYRMYSIRINSARFIQVDAKQRVAALQHDCKEIQLKLDNVEKELKLLQPKIQADVQQIAEKRKIFHNQENQYRELKSAITAIENTEYPEHNELQILKSDLVNLLKKVPEIDRKISEKKKELTDACREKEGFDNESSQHASVLQNIEMEIENITRNIDQVNVKLRRIASTYQQTQHALKVINDELEKFAREKTSKDSQLAKLYKEASKSGERMETIREEEEISNEISEVESKLRLRANITENVDDLKNHINEKNDIIEAEKCLYETARAAVHLLGQSLRARFSFAQQLKQHMVLLLQYAFNYLLKARDFVGSVEVDHGEQTLVLSVIPRDTHLEHALSSTRALSGGERSYTTVAFLVALWSCVDHPFYFLDEYDVFTDVVNRDCLTKLLVNEGKVRPERQYTFLTPQDMSLDSNEIVKIHRLAQPQ